MIIHVSFIIEILFQITYHQVKIDASCFFPALSYLLTQLGKPQCKKLAKGESPSWLPWPSWSGLWLSSFSLLLLCSTEPGTSVPTSCCFWTFYQEAFHLLFPPFLFNHLNYSNSSFKIQYMCLSCHILQDSSPAICLAGLGAFPLLLPPVLWVYILVVTF